MTLAEFGAAIMAYRKAHSLSQYELGNLCGVSQSTICAVERGRTRTGEPFLPFKKTIDKIQRVIGSTDNITDLDIDLPRKEPTMNNAEIDKRNTAKLRAILLALLNEEDAPETTPAAVTPTPTAVPTQKNASVYQGYRVGIEYDKKSLRLSVIDGDNVLVTGWSYIRHYKDANDPVMDMVAAISYAAHMAYKNYEQGLVGGGGND